MLNKLKLNQKGLAISGILYSILVLFLILLFSILALLASSKYTFDKLKNDVIDKLSENTETETLSSCFTFDTSTGTILDYNAASSSCPKAVVIPETIDDVAVKYIGSKSFYNKGLTSVDFSQAIYLKEIKGGTAETGAFASNSITKVKFGTLLNFTTFGGYDFYNNKIAGTLDLRGLPNISKLPTKIFASNKITGIDFSNNKKLTEIGSGAFYQNKLAGELDLTALKKLKTIGEGAFSASYSSGYNALTSVKLDGLTNLTTISKTAFYNNALTDFDFTKLPSLTSIGSYAFSQNNLTKVDFSNNANLTTISEEAFYDNAIKTLIFRNNLKLTSIGEQAFYSNAIEGVLDLTGAPNVSLSAASIFAYNQITGVKYNGTILGQQIFASNNFTSIDFNLMPNLTDIYARAFLSNNSLTTVNLEVLKRLKTIGSGAFGHCSLTSIKFPNTLTSIESYAFYSNAIEGVLDFSNIEGSLTIGTLSFFDNLLTNVNLPSSYTLNGGAFNKNNFSAERAHYTQKKTRTLEDGTTHEYIELVSYASNNADEVTIPAEVESIGDYAYHGGGIKKINLHSEIFKIGNYALGGNDLGDVIDLSVSPKIETIGTYAFQGTYSLGSSVSNSSTGTSSNSMSYYNHSTSFSTSISTTSGSEGKQLILTGLNKLESIGDHAFYSKGISTITGWTDLTALETIGQYAFASNYVATLDFSVLASLTSIGNYAFQNNTRLTSINFNGATSLTSIGSYAFSGCTTLATVDFTNLPALTTINSYAFQNAPITSDIDFANSANLNSLSNYAFYGNRCAGTINLANTALTSISSYAFHTGTTGKTTTAKIILPANAQVINGRAFYGLNANEIVWPSNIRTISDYAFYYNGLTELTIPSTVTTIGNYAFMGNDLVTLVIPNNVTSIATQAFANNQITNLTLPSTSVSYGTNVFENNKLTILDLSASGLTAVASGMFKNNLITNLTLGSRITNIKTEAFYGNRMSEITIPVNVTTIGNNAFKQTASYPWENVIIEYNDTIVEQRFITNWNKIGWPIELMPGLDEIETVLLTNEPNNFEFNEFLYVVKAETPGQYKLEVWGAQGGTYSSYKGGKGGYSSGILNITEPTDIYIYVGGQPSTNSTSSTVTEGGYNGGGEGANRIYSGVSTYGQGGGGATDIRIGSTSLYARVIVAGGGGGSASDSSETTKFGGGITSGSPSSSYTANQVKAGKGGSFGQGAAVTSSGLNYKYSSGGGGGGWYGGGAATDYTDNDENYRGYNGGGSGWVYTEENFSIWQSGNAADAANWLLPAEYYLTSATTIPGNEDFTSPTGETETGHSGNGYARITYIG